MRVFEVFIDMMFQVQVFWFVTPCNVVVGTSVSEFRAASIFMVIISGEFSDFIIFVYSPFRVVMPYYIRLYTTSAVTPYFYNKMLAFLDIKLIINEVACLCCWTS